MKKHNKAVNIYHKEMYIGITLLLCLFFMLVTIFFAEKIFAIDKQEQKKNITIDENKNPIDLDKIINENIIEDTREEICVEEVDIEYTTIYKTNSELANGVIQVLQEGRVGQKNVVVIKKYQDDELISEEEVSESIIKAPIDRIVEIGNGKYYSNYDAKEGDTVYAVATSVAVRLDPDETAEKICTLNNGDSAIVLEICDDWYFISTIEIKGYVPKNCMTTKNPNEEVNENSDKYTKAQLMSKLSFNMDLKEKSGLSLDQFKKVLTEDENDKKNIFSENAEYFYYIEQQYNVNGIFVASVGIHESAWGTSAIANNKKNLFGYGAVDSNPYGGAYSFETYAEGIDLIARVFVKYYLNSPGTIIYDGSSASGKFYKGSNLTSVNSTYASDKNWANSVYKWMEYLYNKL